MCVLDANRTVSILIVSAGSYDGNGFLLITSTRTTVTGGVLSNVNISAGTITNLSSATFNGTCTLTKTGTGNVTFTGGNTFNGPFTFNKDNTGRVRFAGTNGDVFNDDAVFINGTSSPVQVAYADTTYFNGNLTLDNSGTGGLTIGAANTATAVSYIASGGALLTNGYSDASLIIRRMTQNGTAANGAFTPTTATLSNCSFGGDFSLTSATTTLTITNCSFTANCTLVCETNLTLTGVNNFSTVSGATSITRNVGTAASDWTGGNTFGNLTVTNNSTLRIRLANTNGDTFLGTAAFINTNSGGIDIARNGTSTFAEDITITNSGTGAITIGGGTGSSNQAAGALLNGGLGTSSLTINRFTQSSSSPNDPITCTSFSALNCNINGYFEVTTNATTITLNGCSFTASSSFTPATSINLTNANNFSTISGSTAITVNSSSTNVNWTGGNVFGNLTLLNGGTGLIRLAFTNGDTFTGTAVFNSTDSGGIQIAFNGTNTFASDITLDNTGTGSITFGGGSGTSVQSSGALLTNGFNDAPLTSTVLHKVALRPIRGLHRQLLRH